MDKIDFTLNYRELKEVEHLYDGYDLHKQTIVPAEYLPRKGYESNPDVCAIPALLSENDIIMAMWHPMPGYDPATACNFDINTKLTQIMDLQNVSCCLATHFSLAQTVNQLLLASYKSRETRISRSCPSKDINPFYSKFSVLSIKNELAGRTDGFLMIGASGSGKSMAMSLVSATYPKVIRHTFPDIEYVQIPIIRVTALVGNLTDIYRSIATRIDELLDTGDLHISAVRSASLGKCAGRIKEWIKLYHIGLLIIDEVQFLHFGDNVGSFENIIGISEETGVAFGLIGNTEVLEKVDSMPRIAGRVLKHRIVADRLNQIDRNFFVEAAKDLWEYQWVKPYIEMTPEILSALLYESGYNVAILKALIIKLQTECVMNGTELNEKSIHEIAGEDFKALRRLTCIHSPASDIEFYRRIDDQTKALSDILNASEEEAKERALEQIQKSKKQHMIDAKIAKAVGYISACCDCGQSEAERAVREAIVKDPTLELSGSPKDLVREGSKILEAARKKVERKAKRKSMKSQKAVESVIPQDVEAAIQRSLSLGGSAENVSA